MLTATTPGRLARRSTTRVYNAGSSATVVTRRARVDARHQHVIPVVSDVHMRQGLKAPREQRRDEQQQDGERHLAGDQHLSDGNASAVSGRLRSRCASAPSSFRQEARACRASPEAVRTRGRWPIDVANVRLTTRQSGLTSMLLTGTPRVRNVSSAVLPQYASASPNTPPTEASSRLSVRSCRIRRAAPRSHGQTNRHLATATRRARQEQTGNIRARDREQQPHHQQQHDERCRQLGPDGREAT